MRRAQECLRMPPLVSPYGALAGVRVLELSCMAAAPFCGKLLAGSGAEVVKVEAPGVGDPARAAGPFKDDLPHPERSALFLYLNTGKQSITLDVATSTGREMFLRLLDQSDVLLEDLGPGTLELYRLDYPTLEALYPRLIMASLSFYGQTGPYRDYRASELTGFAMSGYLSITGQPDREPVKPAGNLAQYEGGLHAATGIMAALLYRNLTGSGQLVDTSITEAACYAAAVMGPWLNTAALFWRNGNRQPSQNPHDQYPSNTLPCKDGWVHLHYQSSGTSGNDLIALLLEAPELLDARLAEAPNAHADEIDDLCLPWLSQHDKFETVRRAQELRVPFTEVLDPREVLADPQHAERGYFTEVDHPEVGPVKQVGAPFRASETPWQTARAPLLGEHNQAVFCDRLGYTLEDVGRLRERGIV